jgi:hypothetical protein
VKHLGYSGVDLADRLDVTPEHQTPEGTPVPLKLEVRLGDGGWQTAA